MKNTIFMLFLAFLVACSGGKNSEEAKKGEDALKQAMEDAQKAETHGTEIKEVKLTSPLDANMLTQGQAIYDTKCQACHKLTDERIVGPGWAGVTKRRQPVWIMNMITNVDMMLEKDAEAQKMLEQCLVRMPNQNVTEAEARSLVEFMRKNDGEK